jgi:DNA-binding winged helix-turn-helix (wHTH) protein
MRLLLCLAEHAGEVVSIDDLLNQVWPEVTIARDSVYQAVTSLRRLLGDDHKQPTYIETVPRLGYRMIATVSPWADQSDAATGAHAGHGRHARHRTDKLFAIFRKRTSDLRDEKVRPSPWRSHRARPRRRNLRRLGLCFLVPWQAREF